MSERTPTPRNRKIKPLRSFSEILKADRLAIEEQLRAELAAGRTTPDATGKVLLTKEQVRDKAIAVLKYAASLCDSKNLSFKNAGYRAACDDIKTCLLASIERLESGEQMEATATVCADTKGTSA